MRGCAGASSRSGGLAQLTSPLLATDTAMLNPLPASGDRVAASSDSVAWRGPGTNTGTPPTCDTVRPKRRSVSLIDPRYAPGLVGSGALIVSARAEAATSVWVGGVSSVARSATDGDLAAAAIGSAAGENAVWVVTPGKRHFRRARNDHCAWSVAEDSLSVAALIRTCANGAGLALGVTAV